MPPEVSMPSGLLGLVMLGCVSASQRGLADAHARGDDAFTLAGVPIGLPETHPPLGTLWRSDPYGVHRDRLYAFGRYGNADGLVCDGSIAALRFTERQHLEYAVGDDGLPCPEESGGHVAIVAGLAQEGWHVEQEEIQQTPARAITSIERDGRTTAVTLPPITRALGTLKRRRATVYLETVCSWNEPDQHYQCFSEVASQDPSLTWDCGGRRSGSRIFDVHTPRNRCSDSVDQRPTRERAGR
jgi:hypothetical protein